MISALTYEICGLYTMNKLCEDDAVVSYGKPCLNPKIKCDERHTRNVSNVGQLQLTRYDSAVRVASLKSNFINETYNSLKKK